MGATRIRDLQPDIIERTESALRGFGKRVHACNGVSTGCSVVEGHPGREIVRFIRDFDVDLVVMATHGRRGIKDFLLGSTTEKVVAGADCPVLVVKKGHQV
jgi:nucleotide-binding universal stress UspA family protein